MLKVRKMSEFYTNAIAYSVVKRVNLNLTCIVATARIGQGRLKGEVSLYSCTPV